MLHGANMLKRFGGVPGRIWRWSFLRHLRRALVIARSDDIESAIRATRQQAALIYEASPKPDPGRKGHMIVQMCSLVLAAYRVVHAQTGDPVVAFRVVKDTMESTFRAPVLLMFRAFLKLYRDPVGKLSRMELADRGRKAYGTSMIFDQEETPDGVDMLVRRCSFHQFFSDHGVPGLTLAVCNWDRNWMDSLNASKRPVRSDRPTTISTGGDCCRFRFVRDPVKPAARADDAVLTALSSPAPHNPDHVVVHRITLPATTVSTP
jgi:L-2-amino-thiazoline-4-carboxylic acid hydrolase